MSEIDHPIIDAPTMRAAPKSAPKPGDIRWMIGNEFVTSEEKDEAVAYLDRLGAEVERLRGALESAVPWLPWSNPKAAKSPVPLVKRRIQEALERTASEDEA